MMKWLLIIVLSALPIMAQPPSGWLPRAGPGLQQKAPPDVVLPVGCSMNDLANCVPQYTGDEAWAPQLPFSLPYSFTKLNDCVVNGGAAGMPGSTFQYPGDSTPQNHVWCPPDFTAIQNIFRSYRGATIGGVRWAPGDIIALAPQGATGANTYIPNGQMTWQGEYCYAYVTTWARNVDAAQTCDLGFPPAPNPTHKTSYMITMNYAQLPAPGNRVTAADHPNMAKLLLTGLNYGFYLGPRVNHWRFVGLEIQAASTNTPGYFWQRGQQYNLIMQEYWNSYVGGKRDLWAANGGNTIDSCIPSYVNASKSYCDYLGGAAEVSMAGQGAIISVSPSTMTAGSSGNIIITTQNSHMCDAIGGVTCSSVQSDLPTYSAFGYGVYVSSNAVANIACPAGVSGTCQTLTASVAVSADAAGMFYWKAGANPGSTQQGNYTVRMPLIITQRSNSGYVDEYMTVPYKFALSAPGIPVVTGVQNATYNNYPIIVMPNKAAGNWPKATQRLLINTLNTTMASITPALTWQQIGIGNGATSVIGTAATVTAGPVISNNQIDVTISFGNTSYTTAGRMSVGIVQGAAATTAATAVPIAIDASGGNDLFMIPAESCPTTSTCSWIQSLDCYQLLAGETYTCHVVGAHTSWAQGQTTFGFSYVPMYNGTTPDVQVTNTTVVDSTHATITVSLDPTAGAGVDHIIWDRVDVHGVPVDYVKNTFGGTAPNGRWMWEIDPHGGPYCFLSTCNAVPYSQAVQDIYKFGGKYVGMRDSRVHDGYWCAGQVNPLTGVTCSIQESHLITDAWGPGPKWLSNNELYNSTILAFTGGAGTAEMQASNVQNSDNVMVHNYVYNTDNYLAATAIQNAQTNTTYPITNLQFTMAGGVLTGVTGTQPTGWNYCPQVVLAGGAGGSGAAVNCIVVAGQLQIAVTNGGSGYTTAPSIYIRYQPTGGEKNLLEHKGMNRSLFYGNVGTNSWASAFGSQAGPAVLLNTISCGPTTDGYVLSYIKNIYVESNWFDMGWHGFAFAKPANSNNLAAAQAAASMLCMTAVDPWGRSAAPLVMDYGSYGSGTNAGGFGDNFNLDNNLVTERDIQDDLNMFPSSDIWNEAGVAPPRGLLIGTQTNMVLSHNTIDKRPGYTQSLYTSFFVGNAIQNLDLYNGGGNLSLSSSTQWNSYIYSNVLQCLPMGDSMGNVAGNSTFKPTQRYFGCPGPYGSTDSSQKCLATQPGGGATWERHFWGNVMLDIKAALPLSAPAGGAANCYTSTTPDTGVGAGFDWTYSGATNNAAVASSPLDQANHYANTSLYERGQRPGDWSLANVPSTTINSVSGPVFGPDGITPGINNARLMAAIGQTTPANIPRVVTGVWTGVIPSTYTISGTITGLTGSIPVNLSSGGGQIGQSYTDASGNYSFTEVAGTYTITPSSAAYTFNPTSIGPLSVSANSTSNNFTAAPVQTGPAPATLNIGHIGPGLGRAAPQTAPKKQQPKKPAAKPVSPPPQ